MTANDWFPGRVTKQYRDNYDAIFSNPPKEECDSDCDHCSMDRFLECVERMPDDGK